MNVFGRARSSKEWRTSVRDFSLAAMGYIVTNEHVVRDAETILITTTERQQCEAKVVGTDALLDMALLKIDTENLPFIPLGNSDDCIVGEWVIALGILRLIRRE